MEVQDMEALVLVDMEDRVAMEDHMDREVTEDPAMAVVMEVDTIQEVVSVRKRAIQLMESW